MSEIHQDNENRSAFSGQQLSNELERQSEVQRLSGDLTRDFYQTFRLSQGETAVQPPLFSLLADQHQLSGHADIVSDALDQAAQRVPNLLPPSRHPETSEEARKNTETGFEAMWKEYAATLREPDKGLRRPLELILDDILVQDAKYQDISRPNRKEHDDPHESIVREYILGDRLTGSQQLMTLRDQMRVALLSLDTGEDSEWIRNRFNTLINEWEANHPEKSFLL